MFEWILQLNLTENFAHWFTFHVSLGLFISVILEYRESCNGFRECDNALPATDIFPVNGKRHVTLKASVSPIVHVWHYGMESMATRHGGKQEAKRPYDHVGLLFLKYVGEKSELPNLFKMKCLDSLRFNYIAMTKITCIDNRGFEFDCCLFSFSIEFR